MVGTELEGEHHADLDAEIDVELDVEVCTGVESGLRAECSPGLGAEVGIMDAIEIGTEVAGSHVSFCRFLFAPGTGPCGPF